MARFSQAHQIRGNIWEVLLPQDAKVGKESQFWGHLRLYLKFKGQNLGYLSPILLEAKFGAPTRISEANFGAKPPDLLIWKYSLGLASTKGPLIQKYRGPIHCLYTSVFEVVYSFQASRQRNRISLSCTSGKFISVKPGLGNQFNYQKVIAILNVIDQILSGQY